MSFSGSVGIVLCLQKVWSPLLLTGSVYMLFLFFGFYLHIILWSYGLPQWLNGKESACNAGDTGSIPGSGRSPGGGYSNSLQYSCQEHPVDRGAWQVTESTTAEATEHTDKSVILYNDSGFNLVTVRSHLFLFHRRKMYWKIHALAVLSQKCLFLPHLFCYHDQSAFFVLLWHRFSKCLFRLCLTTQTITFYLNKNMKYQPQNWLTSLQNAYYRRSI